MGRIKLDTDLELKAPVITNEVHDAQITITADTINVRLDWKHQLYDEQFPPEPIGDPVLVRTEHYAIRGADFDQLMAATVGVPHVGKNFMGVIRKAIRNKIKALKALEGTVE
jgi:hypothetical protein